MVRLSILGGILVESRNHPKAHAVMAQPKRLALLAYLCVCREQQVSRDTLLSLFWSELPAERGHAALRKALHFLREHLGPELIVTLGDSRVSVGHDGIWCDATAFRAETAAGNFNDALTLYRGDLLSGLWIKAAPEFERWVERERSQLRDLASASALNLAQAEVSNDNIPAALFWAQRAELLCPDNEQITTRVLALLDAAGDRSSALRKYAQLAKHLNDDFDAEPSPETRDLIEAIRSRKTLAGLPSASHRLHTPVASIPMLRMPSEAGGPAAPQELPRFRRIVELATDVIYTADTRGCLTYTNPAGARLLGLPTERILGRHYLDFVREDFKEATLAFYLRQLHERTQTTYFELPVLTAGDNTVWLGQHVQLVWARDEIIGTQAIARDVTDSRRAKRITHQDELAVSETADARRRASSLRLP